MSNWLWAIVIVVGLVLILAVILWAASGSRKEPTGRPTPTNKTTATHGRK